MESNNTNKHPVFNQDWTASQRASDALAAFIGSWTFILLLALLLFMWTTVNIFMVIYRWDPYPFILLNLVLSCLAAVHTPVILMSQNRQAQKDRIRSEYDYKVNKKAEKEIRDMQEDLEEIKRILKKQIK